MERNESHHTHTHTHTVTRGEVTEALSCRPHLIYNFRAVEKCDLKHLGHPQPTKAPSRSEEVALSTAEAPNTSPGVRRPGFQS